MDDAISTQSCLLKKELHTFATEPRIQKSMEVQQKSFKEVKLLNMKKCSMDSHTKIYGSIK